MVCQLEYICYDYWLQHPNYSTIENALNKTREIPNFIIERTYDHETSYCIERLKARNELPKFPELFAKYSKMYLVDETVEHVLVQQEAINNLEFYCFGTEPRHSMVFRAKKARNNKIIQYYVKSHLQGIERGNHITI